MSGFFAAGQYWDISKEDNQAIKDAAARLADHGIPDALKETRLLWGSAMPRRYVDYAEVADGKMQSRFDELVRRRCAREPLSHLLGYRDFYRHRFFVSPDVLDPRPDTETLVETALEQPFARVLDLGTGSGCILLSLLAAQTEATGLGVDVSEGAIAMAKSNLLRIEIDPQRADFDVSDWFEEVDGKFDLIVSNPPYIAADEVDDLQPEVRLYEPRIALTDEADGLTAYRKITAGAPDHLKPGGRLIVEIGPTQAIAVSDMMRVAGLTGIEVRQDLDGRDRVVLGRKPL